MCVSINTELAAVRYVNEVLRGASSYHDGYALELLGSFRRGRGWLTNYEIVGRKLQPKITGKPGIAAVDRAITEVVKTDLNRGQGTRRAASLARSVA